jgi:peptidoglycan LD-endopeptidase LytH
MTRFRTSLRLLLATILMAGLLAAPASSQTTAERLEDARAEREALQQRVAEVTAELDDLVVRLEEAQERHAGLEDEVADLERAAAEAVEALVARAVRVYKHGHPGIIETLLTSGDVVETLDRARLLAGASRQEQELLERAVAARAALAQRRAELAELIVTLGEDEERVGLLRAELAAAFGDAQAREDELASRRSRQRQVSRGRLSGTYACPVAAPYQFRDTWGHPRSGGRRHQGTDIFAPMGHPVYAFTDGVIARHSTSRLGGLGLYLRGVDGNEYYYAHLQRIAPGYNPGRRVEAGELIAYNGDTGNARGGAPHVHFELRPGGGGTVNPFPAVAAACW